MFLFATCVCDIIKIYSPKRQMFCSFIVSYTFVYVLKKAIFGVAILWHDNSASEIHKLSSVIFTQMGEITVS